MEMPVWRDVAAAAPPYLRRERVWLPDAWSLAPPDDGHNVTGAVVELPLFTLAPRWFEFYAYIGVGTPPQTLRVVLDTMGSDLSLLGFERSGHENYDHNKSSSYIANNTLVRTTLPATDDMALGVLAEDKITFNADVKLPNWSFTALLDRPETQFYFEDTRADGWLGLGRSKLQQAYPTPSIMDSLISQRLIREPVVGIHINPSLTGLVTFGGVNRQRFVGEISYVDIIPIVSDFATTDGLWSFRMDGVLINGKPVDITSTTDQYSGGSALLNSVLPVIEGPRDVIHAINAALGQDAGQRVPCTSEKGVGAVNITFVFGGKSFSLKRDDVVTTAQNGPGCVSLLVPSRPSVQRHTDWSFGAPFMQAFYTALHYGDGSRPARIGFAHSRRYKPPSFSAYDSLWIVLLALVIVLIMWSIGRKKPRRPPQTKTSHDV